LEFSGRSSGSAGRIKEESSGTALVESSGTAWLGSLGRKQWYCIGKKQWYCMVATTFTMDAVLMVLKTGAEGQLALPSRPPFLSRTIVLHRHCIFVHLYVLLVQVICSLYFELALKYLHSLLRRVLQCGAVIPISILLILVMGVFFQQGVDSPRK
jgi:hypothetical protein